MHIRMDLKLNYKHIQKPHSEQALKSSHAHCNIILYNAVFLAISCCVLLFSFVYYVLKYLLIKSMYIPFSCLGITMHTCMFEGYKKILAVGYLRFNSKLSIYTYLTFHSLRDNQRITEKLFTQQD